jgi:hypothetical protein
MSNTNPRMKIILLIKEIINALYADVIFFEFHLAPILELLIYPICKNAG